MKRTFKERISRFASFVTLLILAVAISVFSTFIPEFLISFPGRVFACIWAITAIAAVIAYTQKLSQNQYSLQRQVRSQSIGKLKKQRHQRMLGGT